LPVHTRSDDLADMSDTAVATIDEPSRAQLARREASKPGRVTGKLRRALDLMVWEGIHDNEAAVRTGMTLSAIRLAFQRPHVRAYLKEQREVLRARECGRNFHTLLEVRDQKRNAMARIKAVQEIERPNEDASAIKHLMPGFVVQIVQINNAPAERSPSPEANAIEHDQ